MKQVGPTSGIVPPSVATPSTGEEGQPASEVGPIFIAAEVASNAHSFVLVKRKMDDVARPSGCKKSKAPMSLYALRQVAGFGPTVGCLTTMQDVPSASPTVEAHATATTVTPTPSLPLVVVEVVVSAT